MEPESDSPSHADHGIGDRQRRRHDLERRAYAQGTPEAERRVALEELAALDARARAHDGALDAPSTAAFDEGTPPTSPSDIEPGPLSDSEAKMPAGPRRLWVRRGVTAVLVAVTAYAVGALVAAGIDTTTATSSPTPTIEASSRFTFSPDDPASRTPVGAALTRRQRPSDRLIGRALAGLDGESTRQIASGSGPKPGTLLRAYVAESHGGLQLCLVATIDGDTAVSSTCAPPRILLGERITLVVGTTAHNRTVVLDHGNVGIEK